MAKTKSQPKPQTFSYTDDYRGSMDVLTAMLSQVKSWRTPDQLPAVLELLEHCCSGPEDDKLLREYANYLRRLDPNQTFEGRSVRDYIDDACRSNARLAKLLARRD